MKYVFVQIAVLAGIAALVGALGRPLSLERWGPAGLRSMWAAAAICLSAAVVAAVPVTFAALVWPQYLGHAALAGTVIRLILTGALGLAYQLFADVHLVSFLAWMLVLYLGLLAAETTISILLVRRAFRPAAGKQS